ncbi:MAG: hypothetical protein ACI4NM_12520 [Bullifex sp.]
MAKKCEDRIVDYLKKTIEKQGYSYLKRAPMKICNELKKKGIPSVHANGILYFLVSDVEEKSKSLDELKTQIEDKLFLREPLSEQLAYIFSALYSADNLAQWKNNENKGFEDFCSASHKLSLSSSAYWRKFDEGPFEVTMDCIYKVGDRDKAYSWFENDLKENPFMTVQEMEEEIEGKIQSALDSDLDEYCNSDDYYPPVIEDYDFYDSEKIFGRIGLVITECEFSSDGPY